jgi:hypothetical protein
MYIRLNNKRRIEMKKWRVTATVDGTVAGGTPGCRSEESAIRWIEHLKSSHPYNKFPEHCSITCAIEDDGKTIGYFNPDGESDSRRNWLA